MDSNTFWIIFETSNIFTKSGPLHPLFITKHFRKYKTNPQKSLTIIIFAYLNISKIQIFKNLEFAGHQKFENYAFLLLLFLVVQNQSSSPRAFIKKRNFTMVESW